MKSKVVPICYLCRKRSGVTSDHVPPKNLFPRPRPSNLITVPCCRECNNRFSKHDEYFRLFASCCINRSSEGHAIWQQRVVLSTLSKRRIGKLIDEASRRLKQASLILPGGQRIPVGRFEARARPIRAVLLKTIKGLLDYRDPKLDTRSLSFEITQMDQFKFVTLIPTLTKLHRMEFGSGVFEFWWGIDGNNPPHGVWYFRMYESAAFLVMHRPRLKAGLSHQK